MFFIYIFIIIYLFIMLSVESCGEDARVHAHPCVCMHHLCSIPLLPIPPGQQCPILQAAAKQGLQPSGGTPPRSPQSLHPQPSPSAGMNR